MSHGSYDSNLGSEILILAGDIRSRSWPNIGGTYGKLDCYQLLMKKCFFFTNFDRLSGKYVYHRPMNNVGILIDIIC